MKVAIVGDRNLFDYNFFKTKLENKIKEENLVIEEIVTGDARGADAFAIQYAKENNIPVKSFKANWFVLGKSAGPRRNMLIAEYADCMIAFFRQETIGTKNAMNWMNKAKKKVYGIYVINDARRAYNSR